MNKYLCLLIITAAVLTGCQSVSSPDAGSGARVPAGKTAVIESDFNALRNTVISGLLEKDFTLKNQRRLTKNSISIVELDFVKDDAGPAGGGEVLVRLSNENPARMDMIITGGALSDSEYEELISSIRIKSASAAAAHNIYLLFSKDDAWLKKINDFLKENIPENEILKIAVDGQNSAYFESRIISHVLSGSSIRISSVAKDMDILIREQKHYLEGLYSDENLIRIGELTGSRYIIRGSYFQSAIDAGSGELHIKILDLQSGLYLPGSVIIKINADDLKYIGQ